MGTKKDIERIIDKLNSLSESLIDLATRFEYLENAVSILKEAVVRMEKSHDKE